MPENCHHCRPFFPAVRREPPDPLFLCLPNLVRNPSPPWPRIFRCWTAPTLIQKIRAADPAGQEAILALLRRVEDAALPNSPINLLAGDEEFNFPATCLSCPGQPSFFAYGLGRVRVDAYLPTSYHDTFSCCFTFLKKELSSVNPSLSGRMEPRSFLPTAIWGFHLSGYRWVYPPRKRFGPHPFGERNHPH